MEKSYYLIEKSGDNRQVFGPYSLEQANKAKGARYAVITGRVENGQTISRGMVNAMVTAGSIQLADGSDPWALS